MCPPKILAWAAPWVTFRSDNMAIEFKWLVLEGGGVTKSTDQGQTWTSVADGNTAGGLAPFELPDGRKDIPFSPNALSYSPFRNAFYATYFTCSGTNEVPADSIQRFGWDYR